MGKKKKLKRFAETGEFPHFFQVPYHEAIKGFRLKGEWGKAFFHNTHPIVLELGCGKGEYTVGLARKYPERNFIGLDIKGARMWRGAKTSLEEGLENVAFLRTRIELINYFLSENEVSELWITFPDPQLRQSRSKKRLTHPIFLNRYRKLLKKNHLIHLKTDNPELFHFTLSVVKHNNYELVYKTEDLYKEGPQEEAAQIQTFYERMWLEEGLKIHYLKFIMDTNAEALVPHADQQAHAG